MRLKKGFTLAEILIVLMVIGVIATMTIPSMMKGVTEAQLKAGYKKAYNTIANFAAMERVAGAWPAKGTAENMALLYQGLNSSLSVKTFARQSVNEGAVLQSSDDNYKACITAEINGTNTTIGSGNDCFEIHTAAAATENGTASSVDEIWIVTEDNIAYTVQNGGRTDQNCATKQAISAAEDDNAAAALSCFVMVVDVNGLAKGPNTLETQGLGQNEITDTSSMETLTGDQYKIYTGLDGATSGPRSATVTGRIMADLK